MTRTCQMSNNLYDASLKVPPLKNASISLSFQLSLKQCKYQLNKVMNFCCRPQNQSHLQPSLFQVNNIHHFWLKHLSNSIVQIASQFDLQSMKIWGEYYEQFSFSFLKSNRNNFEKFEVYTAAQKMKFSIKDFFGKCYQIRSSYITNIHGFSMELTLHKK